MSFDENFLSELVEALAQVKLEIVFIGNAAAILHGVPVLTHDVDLMVRDHPQLEKKLHKLAQLLDVSLTQPYQPFSKVFRAVGLPVSVDFILALSSRKSFESVKSRAAKVRIGRRMAWVASLEDVIAAKEAAGRPKDKATLQILKETLKIDKTISKGKKKKRKNNNS